MVCFFQNAPVFRLHGDGSCSGLFCLGIVLVFVLPTFRWYVLDGSCSGLFCLGIVKPCANDLALARQNAPTIWLRPTRTCQRSGFALHNVPHTVRVYIIAAPTHCQLVSAKRRVSFPYVVELQSGEPQRRQQGSAKWGLCPWEMRGVCPNTHQVTSRACTGGPWGGEGKQGGGEDVCKLNVRRLQLGRAHQHSAARANKQHLSHPVSTLHRTDFKTDEGRYKTRAKTRENQPKNKENKHKYI